MLSVEERGLAGGVLCGNAAKQAAGSDEATDGGGVWVIQFTRAIWHSVAPSQHSEHGQVTHSIFGSENLPSVEDDGTHSIFGTCVNETTPAPKRLPEGFEKLEALRHDEASP